MESTDRFINPDGLPPQLTRADLARLTPAQVVQAQEAGQFDVLLNHGRDPIGIERRGERRATDAEDVQAHVDQAEAQRVAAAQHRDATRRAMTITEGL